ncbi:hypothetical protein TNCV_780051 [Trichonephila clavipes]|nr:hypothetical protein TNCV_780051 [Trichonephila clavipes]
MPAGWRLWFVTGLFPRLRVQPDPSWWIFMIQKIDSGHVNDYTACKRSLESLFGLLLGKLCPSRSSHRQSSGASHWEGKCESKLHAVIGIAYRVPR